MRRSVLGAILTLLFAVFVWPKPLGAQQARGKVIYQFQGGADGSGPYSDLTIDAAGNLYGTTQEGGIACNGYSYGCGTVFELVRTKSGWQHQVLYRFGGTTAQSSDGQAPKAGLVFDASGNLYGTTSWGGKPGCGTVFKLAPNSRGGWSESILYSFGCFGSDGFSPDADLVFDNQGNLYGTTPVGGTGTGFCGGELWGAGGCGIAFRLSPNGDGSWTKTTIYNFQGAPDAAIPIGALVPDGKGGFYGASQYGGAGACGTGDGESSPPDGCSAVFELTPSAGGWTESVIYSFFRGRGFARNPSGGFIVDGSGRLFNASSDGGNGLGTIFQLDNTAKGWSQSVLYRFSGDPDGRAPVGRLAKGPQNTWFGVTKNGGASGYGTVCSLASTEAGWEERVLFSFDSVSFPEAGPAVDSQGHIYGTTLDGGSQHGGTVYEVIP